jgi:excisionase family DNA binding protein
VYNINRQEAADILWISTRSIDRYVKSWKIRSKKDWKIVLVNSDDVNILNSSSKVIHKVILSENDSINTEIKTNSINSHIVKKDEYEKVLSTFEKMYSGFREEVKQKDEKIQELSIRVWKAEQEKSNSIDLMEYKKVQFLSEQSKSELSSKLEKEISLNRKTIDELKYEKNTNKLLIVFIVVLFVISGFIFFVNI